jgi:hypothetical protein
MKRHHKSGFDTGVTQEDDKREKNKQGKFRISQQMVSGSYLNVGRV